MADNEVTCRRCSVVRVNTLCRLYDEGFREKNERAGEQLKILVELSRQRGYADGAKVLIPALSPENVRRLCWNISSLLTDQDFKKNGVPLDGRGSPSDRTG